MLESFETFDSDFRSLLQEFIRLQGSLAALKKGFINDEDRQDLEDIEIYLNSSMLQDFASVIEHTLTAEIENLTYHAKKISSFKKDLDQESKLNDIKLGLPVFYGKYFNLYFSLYGLEESWIEIKTFYYEKIWSKEFKEKRMIPKIQKLSNGLIKITGDSIDTPRFIKPEGGKDYLDCKPDFDYWVKEIFKIEKRAADWSWTGAYEIAGQMKRGKEKDFDPKLLKENIIHWENYCNETEIYFQDYLRKEDQRKWNLLSEKFFRDYSLVKMTFFDNLSQVVGDNHQLVDLHLEPQERIIWLEDMYLPEEELRKLEDDEVDESSLDYGYVYLIRNKDIYKIGITKNLLQRMEQLKPDELLNSVRCSNYRELEKEIHKQFKEFRIPQTEYFRLNKSQLKQVNIRMTKGADF